MIRGLRAVAIAMCLVAPLSRAQGQTAIFAGAVVRDTLSHGISGALVSIPELGRSDTSDARGEFKMTGLRGGRFAILIRRIGFQPMVDTVLLVNGTDVEREYVMDANVVQLDSMRVTGKADLHLTPHLALFEEHRRDATGGHFITDSLMRKNESRAFVDVITSYVPGIRLYHPYPKTRPTVQYISSGRGPSRAFGSGGQECPVTLIIDGIQRFGGANADAGSSNGMQDIPDMGGFQVNNYAAVEYYQGGASLPLQYNQTGGGCGVLVLWTREKM